MNTLGKMSFKAKILGAIAVIVTAIVIALVIVINSLTGLVEINQKLDESYRITRVLSGLRADNARIRTLILEAIDPANVDFEIMLNQAAEAMDKIRDQLNYIENRILDQDELQRLFDDIKRTSAESNEIRLQQLDLIRAGQHDEASVLFRGRSYILYDIVYQNLSELEKLLLDENEMLQQQADTAAVTTYISLIAIGTIAGLLVIIVVIGIFRMISRIAKEMKEAVVVLGASTAEIQTTVAEISTGANETATAISETTTTIEEIRQTSMVANNKSKNLLKTSQKASQDGEKGLEASQQMIDAMQKIDAQMKVIHNTITKLSEQNRSIGEITSTVADIADQSNLLAVNAAIEAAKAGEHGRGFAVVAQEIRSLAEQSKKSTAQVKEILNQIQNSVSLAVEVINQGRETVDDGADTVRQDREVVEMLIESINEAVEAAVQISSTSQQQMAGMEQIVPAMENIKKASEQNVTGIKQTQEASENLQELSQSLSSIIERYRL
jgi:methyl-accepting chemotaxis protein